MKYREYFINPFVVGAVFGIITGNPSLGLVVAGFTALIWGLEPGMNFITLTTILLVILTGNINMELIFLYSLTLAYFIREGKVLKILDKKTAYVLLFFISTGCYFLWKFILGLIPVQLLNEINISGEILLTAGLLLSFVRGKELIGDSPRKFLKHILVILTAVIAIKGSWFFVGAWFFGNFILSYLIYHDIKFQPPPFFLLGVLGLLTLIAIYYLLPLNPVIILTFLTGSIYFIKKYRERVPIMETVYVAFFLGILAGRMGLLS
ncbi:hypothetical protein [Halothermothrix orenii]|uniref:Uncharacterized protein n=1 Tax=Halothermothrix orenii (strain H 168 / OCM 544 / DSM 9562) TaxID=373903 RepID=B8CYH1_HALOH|nr:hypothetical protein [Halothermothrix orenii]ACL70340.1 hypothetical protein Hore_15910 [Halothermothrix orenii H 168]